MKLVSLWIETLRDWSLAASDDNQRDWNVFIVFEALNYMADFTSACNAIFIVEALGDLKTTLIDQLKSILDWFMGLASNNWHSDDVEQIDMVTLHHDDSACGDMKIQKVSQVCKTGEKIRCCVSLLKLVRYCTKFRIVLVCD